MSVRDIRRAVHAALTMILLAAPMLTLSPASPWAEEQPLLQRSVGIKILGETATMPLAISAVAPADTAKPLQIIGRGKIGALLPKIARQLEREVSALYNGCEQRLSAWGSDVTAEDAAGLGGVLNLRLTARAEIWNCKLVKTRLGRETTTLHASIRPAVRDGKLQLGLVRFRMDDLGVVSKAFGLEDRLRRAVQDKIDQLNADPAFYAPPIELTDAGYTYHSAVVLPDAEPQLVAIVSGPNKALAVLQLIGKLAEKLNGQ